MEINEIILNNKMQQRQISIQLTVVFGGGAIGLALIPITTLSGLLITAGIYFAFVWFKSYVKLDLEIEDIIEKSERKKKCLNHSQDWLRK